MLVATRNTDAMVVAAAPEDGASWAFVDRGLMLGGVLHLGLTAEDHTVTENAEPVFPIVEGRTTFDPDTGAWGWQDTDAPQIRQSLTDRVNAEKTRRLTAGFDYAGHRIPLTAEGRTDVSGATVRALRTLDDPTGTPWPNGFRWIDADNGALPLETPADMLAFGMAMEAAYRDLVLKARAAKDSLETMPVPDLATFDPEGGW